MFRCYRRYASLPAICILLHFNCAAEVLPAIFTWRKIGVAKAFEMIYTFLGAIQKVKGQIQKVSVRNARKLFEFGIKLFEIAPKNV